MVSHVKAQAQNLPQQSMAIVAKLILASFQLLSFREDLATCLAENSEKVPLPKNNSS